MELFLTWYGTVGVYLEHNGIKMEDGSKLEWTSLGEEWFGRKKQNELLSYWA